MPYHIEPMPHNKAYVVAQNGKHLSLKPLPIQKAKKQLVAVNIAHARKAGLIPMRKK